MKIGFIGAGNMAGAIISGIAKTSKTKMIAYDIDFQKTEILKTKYGIETADSMSELLLSADMLVMGIKPYQIEAVLKEYHQAIASKPLISIALGWDLERYRPWLGDCSEVLCLMPNTPCQVLSGIFLINEQHSFSKEHEEFICQILKPLGVIYHIPAHLMNAAGTLSGCGPAFAYLIIEALADGAVKHGVDRKTAIQLASTMLAGASQMVLETNEHPAKLKDDVCSPGGSTILGVEALYKGGLFQTLMDAISASINHS